MPPVLERVKVEHRGSLTFHVSSESKEEEFYTIDMAEHEGNGVCTCRDFATRCEPEFRQAQHIREYGQHNRTRCKHINAVVIWIGNEAIRRAIS